ncbi:MAG: FAD-binding domain-containing protein [Pseudomonadota bacterium]
MSDALDHFPPNRIAALERLARFVPHAGRTYMSRRNHDLGPGRHDGVSQLSPYIRTRLLTESDVLEAVLGRHSLRGAEKFVQEVYWRTYWKGWLEMRPGVWTAYQRDLSRVLDDVQTQSGLRNAWEAACKGETGIECFDAWAQELVETGYMHNHARMWFASIWIFTLGLPWELGADFFLRHLLDGDPASNTLSWRWVGGLQTRGKTYLARPSNIAKYTEGRFRPTDLAPDAPALSGELAPDRQPLMPGQTFDPALRTGLVLHDDDLSPGFVFSQGLTPVATTVLNGRAKLSPLKVAPHVIDFARAAADDTIVRFGERLGPVGHSESVNDLVAWAEEHELEQIVAPYAPVGPNSDVLCGLRGHDNAVDLRLVQRDYDSAAWPYATAGFFKFKEKIPSLVGGLEGLRAAE